MKKIITITVYHDSPIFPNLQEDTIVRGHNECIKDFIRSLCNDDKYQLEHIKENICRQYGVNIEVQRVDEKVECVGGSSSAQYSPNEMAKQQDAKYYGGSR